MPQVTVYVSDELFARVTAAKGQLPGPSAVFAEAIQQRLDDIESERKQAKGGDSMAIAIARLRSEKKMGVSSALKAGFSAGEKFALDDAPYALLAQLDEVRRLQPLSGRHPMTDLLYAHDMGDIIADLLRENEIVDDDAVTAFWNSFLRGALEVWNKVKAQI